MTLRFRRLRDALGSLKMRDKLILSFIVLIAAPLGLYSYITSLQVYNHMRERTTYSVTHNFDQTYEFLSYKLIKVREASDVLLVEKLLNEVMRQQAADVDFFDQVRQVQELRPFLSTFQNPSDISRVSMYVNPGLFYANENSTLFNLSEAQTTRWFRRLVEDGRGLLRASGSEFGGTAAGQGDSFLALLRPVKNPNDYRELLGIIRLDIRKSTVENILANAAPVKGSLTYIENGRGEWIASSDLELVAQYRNADPALFYRISRTLADTDLTMITLVPTSRIATESRTVLSTSLALLAGISVLAIVLAVIVSNYMTARMTFLMRKMRNVQAGSLVPLPLPPSRDELGELVENYNFMVTKIAALLDEQFQSGQSVKNAELKALQAQINPHFLYNTLDMLAWMSRSGHNRDIEQVVTSLSGFYKLSLSRGQTVISLRDELEHVRSYVRIQQARYQHRIRFEIRVPDELLDFGILKITLQPLVENAIQHGLMCRDEEAGTVTIEGRKEAGMLLLSVGDDGAGVALEGAAALPASERSGGSGYGLRNIQDRLCLFYGEEFGLAFVSEPGHGTTVTVRLPALPASQSIA